MNHRIKGRKLNRTTSHRTAMQKNMIISLVEHEKIVTTHQKALESSRFFAKLITKAKNTQDVVSIMRFLNDKLRNKSAVQKIAKILADRYKKRNGGYTRIVKIGNRKGDNAAMSSIELL